MSIIFHTTQRYNRLIKIVLITLLLLTVALLYLPGVNGAFYYDDITPLSPLANITNLKSALVYIFSESSGPLGRPIAMLSFLINISDWHLGLSTGDISGFFIFNITLHIFNGLLIFSLTYVITKLYHGERKANFWLALTVSALWLVLPIHVSTSLIAIQRMAGLSAFFVLSGLLLYTYGLYKQSVEKPHYINKKGLSLQFIGLVFFTLLAMFTKENGALLPVFVLVLEVTLFAKISTIKYRQKLRISICATSLLILLLYMAHISFNAGNILPGREFTLTERVLTQPQILMDYFYLAFIPDITAINPFHDNYLHIDGFWSSKKATFSILLVIILFSSALYYRRKYPLFSFAVLWFLAAHLLESTVIALELYFEHRNYIALLGPCLAIIFTFIHIKQRYKKLAIMSFSLYWLLLCLCLLLTTQIWGNPSLAAQTWQEKQVGSARATEYLSNIFLQEGRVESAQILLTRHIHECDSCTNSQAVSLFLSCYVADKKATNKAYNALIELSKTTNDARGVGTNLTQVYKLITNGSCQFISLAELKILNNNFLQSPKSPFNKKLPFLQNLYTLALDEQNNEEAIRLLYLAWQEQPDDNIANELVMMLTSSQRVEEALYFVKDQVCKRSPFNPILNNVKQKQCEYLSTRIEAMIEKESIITDKQPKHN